ncbi:MAG: formate dehydrogenase subunit alpha [candidate division WOR-3 bacterium]|uniref:Formate dehydrogenase subunit alpha n=1 Tax=candidate division WOR-3 bacterium TaxID=2052148 RepID=A0A7V4EAV8_UNCW3
MNVEFVPSICVYCGVGCGIIFEVVNGRIINTYGRPDHPVNEGKLCLKGKKCHEFVHHPERLKKPLIKDGKEFKETNWDTALNLITKKLIEIKEKYGPDSIAVISSAKCTNEENYLIQKFARTIIGTNNIDHCARLCHASSVVGLGMAFGSGAMTNSISEIENAECILVTGSNTTEQHPIIAGWIYKAKKKGAKIIVVEPRKTQLAKIADIYLEIFPGTDVAWINGFLNVIINENLYDKKFIEEKTEGFEELKEVVKEYTPEKVSQITGVNKEDLIKGARIYASSKKSMIIYGMGITQHITGTENVLSLANLAMITGNVGRENTGVNPLRGHQNVQGACDMGALPDFYPGYQKIKEPEIRKKFEEYWKTKLNENQGLTLVEIFEAILNGDIKALYIIGENPVITNPNTKKIISALDKVPFLIVEDIFLTETAKFADVILPATCFAEKEGTYTSTERRVQIGYKAVHPPGEAKSDWEIIQEIAKRMGFYWNYKDSKEIFEEIRKITPIYSGITYEKIELYDGIQWPCRNEEDLGTKYLHKDGFLRGKGKFHPVHYKKPFEEPNEEYPYILTTGRIYFHFHSGSMTRKSVSLKEEIDEAFVEVNPQDARNMNLKDGDNVKIKSRRGEIKVKVKIKDDIKKGVIFIPFHFAESAANILTHTNLDPLAKIPEFKVCAVKIEKAI